MTWSGDGERGQRYVLTLFLTISPNLGYTLA